MPASGAVVPIIERHRSGWPQKGEFLKVYVELIGKGILLPFNKSYSQAWPNLRGNKEKLDNLNALCPNSCRNDDMASKLCLDSAGQSTRDLGSCYLVAKTAPWDWRGACWALSCCPRILRSLFMTLIKWLQLKASLQEKNFEIQSVLARLESHRKLK